MWTPAVPVDFKLKRHFESRGILALKRAELLGAITRDRPTLAVAGTHGKTTTSSWLADMLMAHPEGCHAFLGGIDAATGTNLLTRPGAAWHVVEADEFDRSFHQLHPTHAAVTNLDPDHLDVYGTEDAFREAFARLGPSDPDVDCAARPPLALPESLERFAVVDLGKDVPEGVDHLATLSPETREVAFELHRNDPRENLLIQGRTRPGRTAQHGQRACGRCLGLARQRRDRGVGPKDRRFWRCEAADGSAFGHAGIHVH